MDNKEFAEVNAGKNFTYKGNYKVRLVGYSEETGLLIVSGLPFGWVALSRRDSDVLLVRASVISDKLYYVKPSDLVSYMEKNREFAEKHAGEYFLFANKTRVRVVGYCAGSYKLVLVSLPDNVHTFGWGIEYLDSKDVFTFPTKANKFWYVEIEQLK